MKSPLSIQCFCGIVLLNTVLPAAERPASPWDVTSLQSTPQMTWLDAESPIRELTYRNELFHGQPTDVFAFYATPGTISGDSVKDAHLPAVVLLHGGGGTAFAQWVWLWAKHGYAAIAMDLSGRRPPAPKYDSANQLILNRIPRSGECVRLEHGGPEADHIAKFDNVGDDLTDDWQFHAVAAAMRAHSLIRSFPEVDAERTAVTGISWGGYLTCLVASIDTRFKAAVPVYGCGFLYDGESVQRPLIDRLAPEKRRTWIRLWDPSAWLPQCHVPILFVNGANDKHYPLTSYARSYALVKGPRQFRIMPGMSHSHVHGWTPPEIAIFIDQYLCDGEPLPRLGDPQVKNGRAVATYTVAVPLKSAKLHFTTDTGPLIKRQWKSIPADRDDRAISAELPPNATIWLFSATDTRDATVTTSVVFSD